MRIYLLKFFLISSLILMPNILHAGQSGDEVEENNEYSLEVDKPNNGMVEIKNKIKLSLLNT